MKYAGIKPTDAAIWSSGWAENRQPGTGSAGSSGEKNSDHSGQRKNKTDMLSFSELVQQCRQGEEENANTGGLGFPRMKELLQRARQSSERIRETAPSLSSDKAEPNAFSYVPGLTVDATALRMSRIKTVEITREYNTQVSAGHPVSQEPRSEISAAKLNGIKTVISGEPPSSNGKAASGSTSGTFLRSFDMYEASIQKINATY